MRVVTVRGAIAPSRVGIALPHEHLLFDLRCWFEGTRSKALKSIENAPVGLDNLGEILVDPWISRDNLRMQDLDVATREVRSFRDVGGRTIVDCTTEGIGRDVSHLQRISIATGVNIVAGTGLYTGQTHPEFHRRRSEEELADWMVGEIENGVGATGVRCGIIGEMGTGLPPTKAELRALRAAARAQRRTGAPLNIHTSGPTGLGLLDVVEKVGADVGRVVVSHSDVASGFAGPDYLLALARRGCFVELDTVGSHIVIPRSLARPKRKGFSEFNDIGRIEAVTRLIDTGHIEQILLSHDSWYKTKLRTYGGVGYAYLLRHFVPMLTGSGLSKREVDTILVRNPGRLLAF